MKSFFFLFLCAPLSLMGQTPLIDSLKGELAKAQVDTAIVKLGINIAQQSVKLNEDSALRYCQQVQIPIGRLPDSRFKVKALRNLGIAYYRLDSLVTALRLFEEGKKIAKEINDQRGLAFLYNNIGTINYSQRKVEQAIENYEQSLKLQQERGDINGQIVALNNLGNTYMRQKEWDEAQQSYQQCLQIMEQTGDSTHQANINLNISITYSRRGMFEEAIPYASQGLEIARTQQNVSLEHRMIDDLASLYKRKGDLITAFDLYQALFQIGEKTQDQKIKAEALVGIASIYTEAGEYQKAIDYQTQVQELEQEPGGNIETVYNNFGRNYSLLGEYETALSFLYQALNDGNSPLYPMYNLGSTYEKMGRQDSADHYLQLSRKEAIELNNLYIQTLANTDLGRLYLKRGKREQAETFFLEAYHLSRPYAYAKEKVDLSWELYQFYKEQNQPTLALPYLEHYAKLNDSLFSKKNLQTIALRDAENKFDREKREILQEQTRKLAQERRFRINLLIALGVVLLFCATLVWFFRAQRRANKELNRLNQEIMKQKAIVEAQHEQLKTTQLQLVQAEKMASLGQMTARIAHEIKNPLNFVNNFARNVRKLAEELQEEFQDLKGRIEEQVYEDMEEMLQLMQNGSASIEKNGKRANQIVSSMMQHSQISQSERRDVDLNRLIKENADLAFLGLEPQLTQREGWTHFHLNSGLGPISANPQELSRAFLNILTNAGEAVQGRMDEVGFVPRVDIYSEQQGEEFILRIADNGNGIPEEIHDKLFEPFFTTKPTGQGNVGLGLSIAYDIIVQGHGGKIEINSPPMGGTEFVIRLPLDEGKRHR